MSWRGIVNRQFTPAQFQAYVSAQKWVSWRPSFLVLHNTAVPRLDQWHSTSAHQRMKNLERYYRDQQHWSAGPHLFISDTEISVFTPLTVPGVHSPSWNAISLGVEMVGDYSAEPFDHQVRHNTVSALATLHARLGIDSHTLRFHRDDPRTTHRGCPGHNVSKEDIIERVHELIVARHPGEHGI